MIKRIFFLLIFLFTSTAIHAANISGFVRNSNNQPVSGVTVQYKCGSTTHEAKTNNFGRYRVRGLKDVVWCSVNVNGTEVIKQVNSGSGSKEVDINMK